MRKLVKKTNMCAGSVESSAVASFCFCFCAVILGIETRVKSVENV